MTLAYAPAPIAPAPVEIADVDRGTGRGPVTTVAYTVWVAGYETIKAATGEPISESFVTDVVHIDVPSGGSFGWGEVQHINDWVTEHMPGYTVMDAQVATRSQEFFEF
jgi:hypothetical protein